LKVVWTFIAVERAYEVAEYIARDKRSAAETWLNGLFRSTDGLENFPQAGRMVPEIGLPDYREIVYRKSHRVVYHVEKSAVRILTVRNFAQRLKLAELGLD
jgi:plasmid stabilization system protein ParE